MQRSGMMAFAAILLLLWAPPAAGAAPLELWFRSPAQAGPDVTVLEATWLLITFGAGGTAGFSLRLEGPVVERNITSIGVLGAPWSRPAEETLPYDHPRVLPGVDASLTFPRGLASLYLEGSGLRVEAAGARADIAAMEGRCVGHALPHSEQVEGEARHRDLCPGSGPVVVMRPEAGALPFRVVAESLTIAEVHNGRFHCAGRRDAECPTGGFRREFGAGAGDRHRLLGYDRLHAGAGSLDGGGQAQRVLAGADRLDIEVVGWARLPLADGTPCDGCVDPEGRTLRAEGDLLLHGVRALPDGTLAASLAGGVAAARLDEGAIDPRLLGLAGAVTAATAFAAWAAVVLFSRIPQEESLDHPQRRLLMEAIRQNPGIHVRALARLAGARSTLAQYHVEVLLRNGHAVARRQGKRVCLFENHGRYGDEWHALALLRNGPLTLLHEWIRSNPGKSRLDVVRHASLAWGWSRRTTYHRLQKLERAGLVRGSEEGAGLGGSNGLQALLPPARVPPALPGL